MAADVAFHNALAELSAALEELSAPAMVIGGVAVIAAGVPRQTVDIDAVVLGRAATVEAVLSALEHHAIRPRHVDVREWARDHNVLLMQHESTGVTIDVSFAWLPFEEDALQRARITDFDGIPVRVAAPEDLIIYKATAWRGRDRDDVERVLVRHFNEIDVQRVRDLVAEIAEVLGDEKRLAEFDAVVERARPKR